jgi:menaquinone-dependent protoporphyrinogen oxidase
MPTILLVHASKHGHTTEIARRIAGVLEREGLRVDLRGVPEDPAPLDYDGVVVGASIHAGSHEREIVDWAARHRAALAQRPSAFFSSCLTVADGKPESWATARGYVDAFVERTGWTPDQTATFAGALQYREYGFLTRIAIKQMMRKGGHPTDTSRDYDYTDWDAVEAFAREFAGATARRTAANGRRPKGQSELTAGRRTGSEP